MNLNDFDKHWNIVKPPYLSSLVIGNNFHSSLFINRDDEIRSSVEKLSRWDSAFGGRVAIVSGAPGVGKSSFVRALKDNLDGRSFYISLFDYSPSVFADNNLDITATDYISLFSRIEAALSAEAVNLNNSNSSEKEKFFESSEYSAPTSDINLAENIVRDRFSEMASWLSRVPKKMYLIVDNLDYLSPRDQYRISKPLFWLARDARNVVIIIAGRPFMTMISQILPRQFVGTSCETLCFLHYLKPSDVIQNRFDNAKGDDTSQQINIFDERFYEFLDSYCDGNISLALKFVARLYLDAPSLIDSNNYRISYESAIRYLISGGLAQTDGQVSDANFGFIPNLYIKFKHNDKIPPFLALLHMFKNERTVDENFYDEFRSFVFHHDDTSPKYSDKDIYKMLSWLRGMRIIRRTGIWNITGMEGYLEGKVRNSDYLFRFGSTPTALELVNLIQRPDYTRQAHLQSEPTGYRDFVRRLDFRGIDIHRSNQWIID